MRLREKLEDLRNNLYWKEENNLKRLMRDAQNQLIQQVDCE